MQRRSVSLACLFICLTHSRGIAQLNEQRQREMAIALSPDPKAKRPIASHDTLFMEEMTWMEVRDAIAGGRTTVLVGTGGIEMNGPYVVTGKHNFVVRVNMAEIAKKLGNCLISPVVPFVPEGSFDPPTGHMRYPGSITVRDETYRALLADIVASLKAHGFRNIILMGDSFENQEGMRVVADDLSRQWGSSSMVRVHFVPEYYSARGTAMSAAGIAEKFEGHHDNLYNSAVLMTLDPTLIRADQRRAVRLFSINGVTLDPANQTVTLGRKLVAQTADITVAAIRQKIASSR